MGQSLYYQHKRFWEAWKYKIHKKWYPIITFISILADFTKGKVTFWELISTLLPCATKLVPNFLEWLPNRLKGWRAMIQIRITKKVKNTVFKPKMWQNLNWGIKIQIDCTPGLKKITFKAMLQGNLGSLNQNKINTTILRLLDHSFFM